MVKKFIPYFRDVINEGNIFEIQNIYENSFPKLSLQYFENRPWPDEHEVAPLVDNDTVSIKTLKNYNHDFCINLLFFTKT